MWAEKKCIQHAKDLKYKIVLTVTDVKGECALHKLGEKIEIKFPRGPNERAVDLCPMALTGFFYKCYGMLFGGQFPWHEDPDTFVACCPDFENLVTFEIKRIPLESETAKI